MPRRPRRDTGRGCRARSSSAEPVSFDETAPVEPVHPYGKDKRLSERVFLRAHEQATSA
jgi:hypothetical protein